ncbi:MAG: hypothetical protein JO356_04940, partial [Acidobacteria bacterium]|nr:hypothetical protein [Acidobacteriota bacterium]
MSGSGLLKILAYLWASFGAYWIVLAPWFARSGFYTRFPPMLLILSFALLLRLKSALPPEVLVLLAFAWTTLGLYWAQPASSAGKDESFVYRVLRLIILAFVFSLMFWERLGVGFLGKSWPSMGGLPTAGFLLALAGLALALWARVHLGHYWSDKVMLQADH